MIVAVHFDGVFLGNVKTPTVNNRSIYVDDFAGKRTHDGKSVNVREVLNELWAKWRKEVPEPDTDSEFIDWLIGKQGWQEPREEIISHTIS